MKRLNFHKQKPFTCWDIFCTVIDNFGDIGVCWRLARILSHGYQQTVRLWVDDLQTFKANCPDIDATQARQIVQNVEICHWDTPFLSVVPADIVIETFACRLPEVYLNRMASRPYPPLWINLEYLSAEPWVDNYHGLASPHPTLPLVKYFFFPGFTPQSGGILYEPAYIARRAAFQASTTKQMALWASLAIPPPQAGERRLSLFCYDNAHIPALLKALACADSPSTCLVPQGPAEKQVAAFFQQPTLQRNTLYQQDHLRLYVLPLIEQDHYDQLLWACDINFVRGEDSFIRAQLAARPFIWQIYPQEGEVHHQKLEAFLAYYAPHQPSIRHLWQAWNGYSFSYATAWQHFMQDYSVQQQHAQHWTQQLTKQQDLAAKLILFCKNKIK